MAAIQSGHTQSRPTRTGHTQSGPTQHGPTKPEPTEREARKVAEAARETDWTKPSFGRELFLGRLRLDLIDPWPSNTARADRAGEDFLMQLRPFVEGIDGAAIERDARIPDEVFAGLAELGAFGMKIDKEYGGLGLSNLHYCQALMLIGSANASVGALLSAHQSIGVPQPLKLFGTAGPEAASSCPALAAGEVSAFLLTEPDVGSDPARLATSATPVARRLPAQRREAVGHQRHGRHLLVVMARVPASEGHAAASPRSWWRPTRRASRSSGATPSSACAAWRTA